MKICGGESMLEVKMSEDGCISCCEKGKPTRKININRDKGSHKAQMKLNKILLIL